MGAQGADLARDVGAAKRLGGAKDALAEFGVGDGSTRVLNEEREDAELEWLEEDFAVTDEGMSAHEVDADGARCDFC